MKTSCLSLFVLLFSLLSCSREDDLTQILTQELKMTEYYQNEKTKRIDLLMKSLCDSNSVFSPGQKYMLYDKLYEEYLTYRFDSTFHYAQLLKHQAQMIAEANYIVDAKTKYSMVLSSGGFFKEAIDSLSTIDITRGNLADSIITNYYIAGGRIYHNLADYTNENEFSVKYCAMGNALLNKALPYASDSVAIYYLKARIAFKEGDLATSRKLFLYALTNFQMNYHMSAIMLSTVGQIETQLNDTSKAMTYYTLAAINDIRNVTKETVALRALANILFYTKKDVDKASEYISIALKDAQIYGARHRKIDIGALLPIIVGEKLSVIEQTKNHLFYLIIAVTLISLILIASIMIVVKQKKEIERVKNLVQKANEQLSEANIIKDSYLGHYFVVSAELANMIDQFLRASVHKINQKQYVSLAALIKNLATKFNAVDYKDFDKIFITIFPTFTNEFNSMLREEDRIVLKDNNTLTPTLRIFALIRLGIDDSETISKILNYSLTTIYNYRTRIKHKALEDMDNFEMRIKKIGS